jgi:hypothetical protein
VSLQFPDDSISLVAEPAELGGFGVKIVFEVRFDESGNAHQTFVFWEMGAVRRQGTRQELGRD